MKKVFISYFLLIFLGFTGAHRFYLKRYYSGGFYFATVGFFGLGVLMDFFMLPFMIAEDVEREGGCGIDFGLKFMIVISLFLFFLLVIFMITSIWSSFIILLG